MAMLLVLVTRYKPVVQCCYEAFSFGCSDLREYNSLLFLLEYLIYSRKFYIFVSSNPYICTFFPKGTKSLSPLKRPNILCHFKIDLFPRLSENFHFKVDDYCSNL